MNRIEKLIAELCPEGVEWKKLGEVTISLKKDTLKLTDLIHNGKYPVVNSGREWYGRYNSYNNEGNALTIAARGEYAGYINYISEKFWAGGLCYPYRSKDENLILTKYIFYALKANENIIMQTLVSRGSIPALNKTDIDNFPIPIPPLPIQEEIVKILDTFTALEAALEAELEARKKQYEYYRNKLLTPVEKDGRWYLNGVEVEWKKLGEVIKLNYGKSLKESERDGGKYPVLGSNGRIGFHSSFLVEGPCIIIGRKGSAGAVVWEESNCYPIDTTYFVELKNNDIILKYLFYKLENLKISSDKQEGGVPGINREMIYNISIPIPPLSEQERIVAILDKFDALVNDITQGLPAEIEARRKQYEYYRNKLLNFSHR